MAWKNRFGPRKGTQPSLATFAVKSDYLRGALAYGTFGHHISVYSRGGWTCRRDDCAYEWRVAAARSRPGWCTCSYHDEHYLKLALKHKLRVAFLLDCACFCYSTSARFWKAERRPVELLALPVVEFPLNPLFFRDTSSSTQRGTPNSRGFMLLCLQYKINDFDELQHLVVVFSPVLRKHLHDVSLYTCLW